jgi:hypothetical protein
MMATGGESRPSARQLRASEHLAGAGWSGSQRECFGLPTQIWLNYAALGRFPKLGVLGSSPIARSHIGAGNGAFSLAPVDRRAPETYMRQ